MNKKNTKQFQQAMLLILFVFGSFLKTDLYAQSLETTQPLINSDGSVYLPKNYYPNFNWEVTPQYNMFWDANLLSSEARDKINKQSDFMTIEKVHGSADLGPAENGTRYEATEFHALDSTNKVLFYFNSAYAYPFTSYTTKFAVDSIDLFPEFKNYLIVDEETGELEHRNNVYFYDVLNPDFRNWWVQTVADAIQETGTDGVFVDQMHGFSWLRNDRADEVEIAQGQMMGALKEALPDKLVLCNNSYHSSKVWPHPDAHMFEHYKPSHLTKERIYADWQDMLSTAQENKISIWRIGVEQDEFDTNYTDIAQYSHEREEYWLACFLIGAQPYSFFQYGWGWRLSTGPLENYFMLNKPLGQPLGEYKRLDPNGWEFTRVFENAFVSVDLENQTASIDWIESPEYEPSANLALNGVATQSSTNFGGDASRANDGKTNGAYGQGSVTHTEVEDNPWWQVDLGASYNLSEISVFNRTDSPTRLSNFTVYVLDEDSAAVYSKSYTTYPDPSVTMDVGDVNGRYVVVQINGRTALCLAEVLVAESVVAESKNAVSVKVVDAVTNDSVPLATFVVNGDEYTTNYVGEVTLNLSDDDYPFTLSKNAYDTLSSTLNITQDTAIVLQLIPIPKHNLSIKVTERGSYVGLSEVSLSIDDEKYSTSIIGEFDIVLFEDLYDITLTKTGYQSVDLSVDLTKDTLLTIKMDRQQYSLGFKVVDADLLTAIPSVAIDINDTVYTSDASGMLAIDLPFDDYDYVINAMGYDELSQSIELVEDTVLLISMAATPSGINSLVSGKILVYPNPVSHTFSLAADVEEASVFDMSGKVVALFNKSQYQYDVSQLARGIYVLNVTMLNGNVAYVKLIKE